MPRKTNTAKVLNADPINTDAIIVANTNENVNTTLVANTVVANTLVANTEVKTRKPRVSKKDTNAVVVKAEPLKNANEVVAVKPAVVVTNVEVKPKRGRKSKMELLTALNAATNVSTTPLAATTPLVATPLASPALNNTVELVVNEKQEEKEEKEEQGLNDHDNNEDDNDVDTDIKDGDVKTTKKRGRKPKGGKIIQNFVANETQKIDKPNIILHL